MSIYFHILPQLLVVDYYFLYILPQLLVVFNHQPSFLINCQLLAAGGPNVTEHRSEAAPLGSVRSGLHCLNVHTPWDGWEQPFGGVAPLGVPNWALRSCQIGVEAHGTWGIWGVDI